MTQAGTLIGVDTGGTFTDVALLDAADGRLWVTKTSSTPDDPSRGFGQGIADGVMDFDRADLAPATLVREAIRVARALPILLRSIPRGNGPFSAELWLRYCSGRWSSLRAARRRQRGASTTA